MEGSSSEKFLGITIHGNFAFEKHKCALQEREFKITCSYKMCQIHEYRKKTSNI